MAALLLWPLLLYRHLILFRIFFRPQCSLLRRPTKECTVRIRKSAPMGHVRTYGTVEFGLGGGLVGGVPVLAGVPVGVP